MGKSSVANGIQRVPAVQMMNQTTCKGKCVWGGVRVSVFVCVRDVRPHLLCRCDTHLGGLLEQSGTLKILVKQLLM